MPAQNVVERRHVGSFGVATLHRLLKLSRIAKENNALGGLRDGQYVGQGHLRSFINKEDVDDVNRIGPRPEALGSAGNRSNKGRGAFQLGEMPRRPAVAAALGSVA